MHIFIDESGQFIPLGGAKSRAAAMLALVVPSSARVALGHAFKKLKKELRSRGAEIKGSSLSEQETARIISLLQAYDVVLEAVVLDVGARKAADVEAFKIAQADRLMAHITRDHQPGLIQDMLALQQTMRQLPNQLFLQVFGMWELIPRLLETATMYYSQRQPLELGSFVWRVDAKDAAVTAMEALWTSLIGPLIATKTTMSPMGMIPGGDYSCYGRFDTGPADGPRQPGRQYTDMKTVLREDFSLVSSKGNFGVQIADTLASTLTRALNGTLQKAGWESLGSLFVHRREQTVRLIALSWDAAEPEFRSVTDPRWIEVIRRIETRAKPMLTPRSMQLAAEDGF